MGASDGAIPHKKLIISPAIDTSIPIPYDQLKNRTVVITGGASGIGASIATLIAQHGGHIIIGDLNVNAGEKLIATLRQTSKHDNHHFLRLDVTSWHSQVDFFKQAASLSAHGGIDTVIANAGVASYPENVAFEQPPDYTQVTDPPPPPHRIMNINLYGLLYTNELAISYLAHNPGSSRCHLPATLEPRDRHLLLVSSIAGVAPLPTQPLYCASKHAVVGLFRSLRLTVPAASGIRINMLNPYFTATPILGPDRGSMIFMRAEMARIEDVRDAAVRMVADKNIIGRGLMVVSRGTKSQVQASGLEFVEGDQHGNAVRDVYVHDLEQTDVFTRRMIAVTNLVNGAKGWVEAARELVWEVLRLFVRLLGR